MSTIKANTIENVAGTEKHNVDTMGIEKGSNANGYYTKFPDGTLIQGGIVVVNSVDAFGTTGMYYKSGGQLITLPIPFVGEYAGSASPASPNIMGSFSYQTATTASVNIWYTIALTGRNIRWLASGRWK